MMLAISTQEVPKNGLMDNVLFKLALLFFGIFLFTFLTFLAYGLFTASVESYALSAGMPAASVVDDIDPKIAEDLAKAMEAGELAEGFAAKDPFSDKSGISRIGTDANQSAASLLATTTKAAGAGNSGSTRSGSSPQPATSGANRPDAAKAEVAIQMSTKDRYAIWAERARFGSMSEPSPSIFSIDDLIPVGVVDGGRGQQEIMFLSEAADRIISFPVGTQLFDGWIIEVRSEGVVFGTGDKVVQMRLKSWGRSINTKNSRSYSLNNRNGLPGVGSPARGSDTAEGGGN